MMMHAHRSVDNVDTSGDLETLLLLRRLTTSTISVASSRGFGGREVVDVRTDDLLFERLARHAGEDAAIITSVSIIFHLNGIDRV